VHAWSRVDVVQHPRRVTRFPIDRYVCSECGAQVEVVKGDPAPG
jgi:hypothetical protein